MSWPVAFAIVGICWAVVVIVVVGVLAYLAGKDFN